MTLKGYSRSGGRRSGGIRSVALARADAVRAVEYDAGDDSFSEIDLLPGEKFSLYNFKEDEASYSETLSCSGGVVSVTHELTFMLEKMDEVSRMAVEELCEASYDGLIAVVTTNSDVSLMVGYSRKFGAERPLKVSRSAAVTGRGPADVTGETLSLVSTDGSKSKRFSFVLAL